MKRFLLCFALVATLALAQHEAATESAPAGEHKAEGHGAKEEPDLTNWKWANFVILLGVLGWVISKNAGPFFESRSREIQKGIAEASRLKDEADQRVRRIEEKLSGLQEQIDEIRAEAKQELKAEGDRLQAETAQLLAKIHSQAEQDISSAVKAARQELKAHSVALAVQLAEAKLRGRMDSQAQGGLVDTFVNDLRATRPEVN